MISKFLTTLLVVAFSLEASAEMRRFQNAEQTKSFYAELVGFDKKTKRVRVRMKNGKKQVFAIELLSEEDQKYISENADRLAVGNEMRVSMRKYQDRSVKKTAERIVDRVAPCGYNITLNNGAKTPFTNITINYTLYYAVQDYLNPKRELKEKKGTLICPKILARETLTLKTEPVDIVSGKLEPVIKYRDRKGPDGETYTEPVVEKPGGRRKDQLLGCRVEIVVDGVVVKTESDGSISLENAKNKR